MKKFLIITLVLFFALTFAFVGCTDQEEDGQQINTYVVMTPSGAPSLALAKVMKENPTFGNGKGDYRIIDASNVKDAFISGEADFIIAPTNAGVQLSIKTSAYKMLAVTSWGNLYLVGVGGEKPLAECSSATEFLAQFEGKSIASIGTGAVPDVTFKELLETANVTAEMTASKADLIQAGLASGNITTAILGEPAVTATLTNVSACVRLASISELWKALLGQDFPQASLFVKKSVLEQDKASVDAFLTKVQESIEYLNGSKENALEMGNYMESLETTGLKGAIVGKSYKEMSQKFVLAKDVKTEILQFVTVLNVACTAEQLDALVYND